MNSIELLQGLLKTALASSVAMLLVLCLRGCVRQWLGASAAYLLWLTVPAAWLAVLLPAAQVTVMASSRTAVVGPLGAALAVPANASHSVRLWLGIWALGAVGMALALCWQQRHFVRGLGRIERRGDGVWQAQGVAGLPAVMGVLRPKIVLPAGFERRYDAHEQALVLMHERIHLRRGDVVVNALWALMRCGYWFNPLVAVAMRRFREDQEFSCDERVIAGSDGARRSYGNAMLKTGLAMSPLPVGCHWQDHHPLKERIAMLKRSVPGKKQWLVMLTLSAALSSITGYAAWAAQPARIEAVASQQIFATVVTATLDGEQRTFELRQPAGQPFTFSMGSPKGVNWSGEFTLRPEGRQLRLSGSVSVDGVLVSSPQLLIDVGVPAGLHVSTPDHRSVWTLELQSTPAPVEVTTGTASNTHAAGVVADSKNQAPPSYPKAAFEQSISGKVVLQIDVRADGSVDDVTVVESTPKGVFDEVSIAAARKWSFTPAFEGGKAVAGKVRVPIWFDLDENAVHDDAAGS